jgi:hypothetical protein
VRQAPGRRKGRNVSPRSQTRRQVIDDELEDHAARTPEEIRALETQAREDEMIRASMREILDEIHGIRTDDETSWWRRFNADVDRLHVMNETAAREAEASMYGGPYCSEEDWDG